MRLLQVLFLLVAAACGTLAVPSSYEKQQQKQQQEQQQGSTQVLCDIYNDCVAAPLCHNGQIDTTGGAFIDLRAGAFSRVFCSSPEVCCRKPGVPPPQTSCPAYQACVSDTACNADGTYNTQGRGDSGKAINPLTTCLLEGDTVGVCCATPIVETCSAGSLCLVNKVCPGNALNHDSQMIPYAPGFTTWTRCPLPSGSLGICCQPDIPTYDVCPDNGVCVPRAQCSGGDAFDYTSNWAPYSPDYQFYSTCSVGGSPGICCRPQIPHYESCPDRSICVSRAQCDGQAYDHASTWNPYSQSYVYWSSCPLVDGTSGICCQPKPPIYSVCPDNSLCLPGGQCPGNAYSFVGQWNPYSLDYLYWGTCPLAGGASGVCCQPEIQRYDTCPDGSVCSSGEQCNGEAYDYTQIWSPYSPGYGYWSTCPLGGGVSGICCRPEIIHYGICPGHSLCISAAHCNGDAYDFTKSWSPYSSNNRFWGTCSLAGGDSGLCCLPKIQSLKTCPSGSVCIPGTQCIGQSYDFLNNLNSYTQDYRYWSQCSTPLSSDGTGVCCQLPITDTCGVRNVPLPHPHGLGTGIQSLELQPNEAAFGEFPWQGILFFSNYTFKCGATLVTDRHVLTAAHCVHGFYPTDFRIRLGEWKINTFDEILPYYDADIATVIIHPDFKPRSAFNDIAVLELTKPVPFNYHINIPCTVDASYYKQFEGQRCIATGWGKDAFYGEYQHTLKKIDLPMVPHDVCQSLLRKTRLSKYFILDKSFLCAGGEQNKDACKGDGGGPLVCPDADGRYYLVGITAWGIKCGQKDVPGVYVDVSQVYNFISDVLEGRPIKETYYPGQNQASVDQTEQVVPYSK